MQTGHLVESSKLARFVLVQCWASVQCCADATLNSTEQMFSKNAPAGRNPPNIGFSLNPRPLLESKTNGLLIFFGLKLARFRVIGRERMQKPNAELVWYYEDSATELGFSSSSLDSVYIHREPGPPSQRALLAARRQARIRVSLGQLSPRLRGVLESCYEQRPVSVPLRHEHGLAAGLVSRAISTGRASDWTAQQLEDAITASHVMVRAAHEAFAIAHPRTNSRGTVDRRAARVRTWLAEDGVEVPCS